MSNAQSIYALRNENKKLRGDLQVERDVNHKLKQRIGELTREARELEKESGVSHLILILRNKVENLENLVGVYEKRLSRMADRLTNLAAERNQLYLEVRRYEESWERFNEGLDQVGRGDDRP